MGLFDLFKKDNSPSPEKLIKATKKGNLELVNSLLENSIDVNCRDEKGWTPLFWASHQFKEHTELIQKLIEKGADVNAIGKEGRTALICASINGLDKTVKILMEARADINTKDNEGRTALKWASDYGWVEIVKMLMEAGAQIDDKDEVLTLIKGHELPLPKAQPPFPEFAKKYDLSLEVEVEKNKMELQISAKRCIINWGDDSYEDEYSDIEEKNISHRYPETGSYTITINATGLSRFECYYSDANVTAIYLNNCPQLEWLYCILNKLISLDISRCTALKYLYCGNNKLTSLDLSNNSALCYLSCSKNLLTCLDISNNTQLSQVDCSKNQLAILNVNRNSAIARLMCNNNKLSKQELNRVFNQLPNYNSSYGTVSTWYSGATITPTVFIACGDNPGTTGCNPKIAQIKNWLVWGKAMYIAATIAGTPGHWQEDFLH